MLSGDAGGSATSGVNPGGQLDLAEEHPPGAGADERLAGVIGERCLDHVDAAAGAHHLGGDPQPGDRDRAQDLEGDPGDVAVGDALADPAAHFDLTPEQRSGRPRVLARRRPTGRG